jgi:hypothetical protein
MMPQITRLSLAVLSFAFYVGLPIGSLLPSADSAISEMHAALQEGSVVADEDPGSDDSGGDEGGDSGSDDSD